MRLKRNRLLLPILILILALLTALFFGCAPSLSENENTGAASGKSILINSTWLAIWNDSGNLQNVISAPQDIDEHNKQSKLQEETHSPNVSESSEQGETAPLLETAKEDASKANDTYNTDPVSDGNPEPVEPQDTSISDTALSCTISVSCYAILDNMEKLDPEKAELVPEGGWILKPTQVTFYKGESVFNVLSRTMRQNKIHMEFEDTPMYNSAYIEGIGNLYEFDCGDLSGWMYKVNDWFPNYGCSRYQLKDGDVIEWIYTCDLGRDIGGKSAAGS